VERVRAALKASETGQAGLAEVDQLLALTEGAIPAGRIAFTPNLVRGLDYYTGVIFEVSAPGMPGSIASGGRYDGLIGRLGGKDAPACGGSLGIERILPLLPGADDAPGPELDVAVTVMGEEQAADSFRIASEIRRAGVRAGVYLGSSGKFAKQMKWAADQGARFCVIYGAAEREAGTATIRDMDSGEQVQIPVGELAADIARRCGENG
jgi:histidyl-tRNA synthetase